MDNDMMELVVVEKIDAVSVFVKGDVGTILKEIDRRVWEVPRDIESEHGRKAVASLAYKVARSKTLLDDIGKALVADKKKEIKNVDGNRKKIRDTLDTLRDDYRKPLTEFEEAEKRKKEEEDKLERERLQAMAAELQKYGVVMSFVDLAMLSEGEYQAQLEKAKSDHEAEQKRIEDERIARENEAKRLKAEAERLEKLRQEQEDRERAENEKLIAEEKKLADERAAIQAEKKALEDEKRKEQERKEREAFEKQAAENAKIKAEADRIEKEKAEAAKKLRIEKLRPDREKLAAFAQFLQEGMTYPELSTPVGDAILKQAVTQIYDIGEEILQELEKL
ncbi:MAG: hypothetical protein KKE53_08500 [Proteobacteria bacterium]|nr:hypothetical protein [Pseudomonadota bacterium]